MSLLGKDREIEIKMIAKASEVDMQKFPDKQTVTGVIYACAEKGQFEIQRECEEALDNIWHLLDDEAIETIKEIAPNFCKERNL